VRLNNCFLALVDQGSLVKLKEYSLTSNEKSIELMIKPVVGFEGDKVLSGLKHLFGYKKIIMPIEQKESIRDIRDNRVYPIFGKGLQGTENGKISIVDLTSINLYHRKFLLAMKRIEQLEQSVKSLSKTVDFLSSPAKKQFYEILSELKEAKKLMEPASMEYFQYAYPKEQSVEEE